MALALPTWRISRCVPPEPGMTPSLISGWPNLAVSAAMMMSHIMASSQPPPSAKPATAAIDRLAAARDAVPPGDEVLLVGRHVGLGLHLLDVGAGGERLLAAGDDDAADAVVGLEGVERLVDSSSISWALSALSALGRLSRMRPTRPLVSTMMVSYAMALLRSCEDQRWQAGQ